MMVVGLIVVVLLVAGQFYSLAYNHGKKLEMVACSRGATNYRLLKSIEKSSYHHQLKASQAKATGPFDRNYNTLLRLLMLVYVYT